MSDGSEAEPFRLAQSPSHLLHRAEQLAADRFAQLVGSDGVTLRQFAVLAAIAENPGLSQSDLVRATGIDRSTLADMMNRMEKRGWVVRTASVLDARALSVRLAASGSTILAAVTPYAHAADAAIVDSLPRTKRRSFLNMLGKLAKASEEATAKLERDLKRDAKRAARGKQKHKKRGRARDKS
ncbi:MAG TPA: MarR family transcriptional regulator [Vitreimonas sp.]|jgi:DNA-binding MarR family transcriptional regulator|nr:MarR family transcriptional regulator [Vitreimonas sp.]